MTPYTEEELAEIVRTNDQGARDRFVATIASLQDEIRRMCELGISGIARDELYGRLLALRESDPETWQKVSTAVQIPEPLKKRG